jgi:hypothetical protein
VTTVRSQPPRASTQKMKRYYVEPCDNCGTVTPAPPRDRTWLVMDRQTGSQVSEHDKRSDARAEAAQLNATATLDAATERAP